MLLLLVNDLSGGEAHIGNRILECFDQERDYVLADLVFGDKGNDNFEGVERAHSVIVALLVDVIVLSHLGQERLDHPVFAELLS